jgi:hypothetical protein
MSTSANTNKKSPYDSEAGLTRLLREAITHDGFPQYGYGIGMAAALASRLGLDAVSVLELGVAGGNGLLAMQSIANCHRELGVEVRIAGFDLGTGMPPPQDHRDMPSVWRAGFFGMDRAVLEARLDGPQLVLGEVGATGPAFLATAPPPIGFVSFDLDYYSSTSAALEALLLGDTARYLPRVLCYFDDTVGPHFEMHSRFTGELLAIDEFNDAHAHRKLGKLNGLRYKLLPYDSSWVEGIYVLHLFDHPRYGDYVYPEIDRQFPLDRSDSS